jgi:ribosomal protein S17
MAKYKVGDKVRIVSKRPQKNWNPYMDKYLGKTMTIIKSGINAEGVYYCMEEDRDDFLGHWCWYEDMIAGLAEPGREPCTVELRFDGMITTATLKRGGRDVKTAEARCNPKDTYSRAEGAKAAVGRLFEKKRKGEDKPKESKLKVGDKFVITGNRPVGKCHHYFRICEIVTLVNPEISSKGEGRFKNREGREQYVRMECVRPYKEKSK